jgi:hypothetical protein
LEPENWPCRLKPADPQQYLEVQEAAPLRIAFFLASTLHTFLRFFHRHATPQGGLRRFSIL